MTQWDKLQKRGDWVFVEGITAQHAASLVGHYLARHYGPEAKAICCTVQGGAFVALAHMPEGAVEARIARKGKIAMDRQDRMENLNNDRVFSNRSAKDDMAEMVRQALESDEDPLDQDWGNEDD